MNDINCSMILKNKISLIFLLIIIKINKTNKILPKLKLLYLVFKFVLKKKSKYLLNNNKFKNEINPFLYIILTLKINISIKKLYFYS